MESSKGTQTPTADEEVRYVSVTKSLNLRVDSFENIDDVKDKSSDFEGIESKVFFTKSGFENGQELDFDRKDGSNVHLNLHLGVRLQVNIKVSWGATTTTDDKLISLDVYSWDTIGIVKSKFQDKEGTPANQLTLFYDGKQLDDLQTIAGYAIGNHSTLDAFFLGEDIIKIRVFPICSHDNPIEVMVKLLSTVVNLKRMIHCMTHYAVDRQKLTLHGVLLENSLRLADYNIRMESELLLSFTWRTDGMRIFVETVKGKIAISADSLDTVTTLKMEIKYFNGTPVEQQRLVFNGNKLKNDRTVRDYNIQKDSTLQLVNLVPKLSGC